MAQDTTPATVLLRRKDHYELQVRAQGYNAQELSFRRVMNGWGKANMVFVLGGPLAFIPVGIDRGTGAAYKIEPDTVTVSLEPSPGDTATINCLPLRP